MIINVTLSDFRSMFKAYNRQEQFSYEGLGHLFDYLETIEQDSGLPMVLDVIAICCNFTEGSANEIARDFGIDGSVIGYLDKQGVLVARFEDDRGNDRFIYQNH
jgi:hypothetical protein